MQSRSTTHLSFHQVLCILFVASDFPFLGGTMPQIAPWWLVIDWLVVHYTGYSVQITLVGLSGVKFTCCYVRTCLVWHGDTWFDQWCTRRDTMVLKCLLRGDCVLMVHQCVASFSLVACKVVSTKGSGPAERHDFLGRHYCFSNLQKAFWLSFHQAHLCRRLGSATWDTNMEDCNIPALNSNTCHSHGLHHHAQVLKAPKSNMHFPIQQPATSLAHSWFKLYKTHQP